MRQVVLAAAFALLVSPLTLSAQAPKADPVDAAVDEAVAVLEKALASTKDPEARARLQAAIDAVKKAAPAHVAKPQNELIGDFIDNTAKYKGKVVTFRLAYVGSVAPRTLRDRVGGRDAVPFKGKDPKNQAELLLGVMIPAGTEVPAAKEDEEVIVTFTCTKGKATEGNLVTSITRP